jgi:MFS superfamily sulfate permease-like transporter
MAAPATNGPGPGAPAHPPASLASYRPEWLWADSLAGVTLAAYAIPVGLAYATLAHQVGDANPAVLAVSAGALALLLLGDRLLPGRPVALAVVALYFNVDHVLRQVLEHVDAQRQPVRLVILDLSTSPYVDLAGARMLERLCNELSAREIELRLAEAHATVRDILRAEGVDAKAGPISRRLSVADTIESFERTGVARSRA